MSDLLLFIVVISTLIIGHEFGHFIAAKSVGVKVDEFGIGFPPRLFTLFEAGGTRYTINLLPLGGFVLPAGENDPSIPGGLAASSKWKRILVLAAGPFANILIAFIIFIAAYKFSALDFQRVLISEVQPDTPASAAGLMEDDLLLEIDGTPIDGFEAVQAVVRANAGTPVTLEIQRNEETLQVELTPRVTYPEDQGAMGVILGHPVLEISWVKAAELSADSIAYQVTALVQLPGRLLRGEANPEEARISGFKGMHDMLAWATEIDRTADTPFFTLNLIGIISVGLALANLLPLPALDGGRLLFVFIEILIRRRIPQQFENMVHAVGFVLVIALVLYFNIQDFVNPIQLP